MENGEWKTENGKRKIENGKLKTGIVRRFRILGTIRNNQKTPITLLSNRSIQIRGGNLFCSDITSVFPFAGALDGTIGGIFRTFSMWLTVGEITNVLASIGPHVCAFP